MLRRRHGTGACARVQGGRVRVQGAISARVVRVCAHGRCPRFAACFLQHPVPERRQGHTHTHTRARWPHSRNVCGLCEVPDGRVDGEAAGQAHHDIQRLILHLVGSRVACGGGGVCVSRLRCVSSSRCAASRLSTWPAARACRAQLAPDTRARHYKQPRSHRACPAARPHSAHAPARQQRSRLPHPEPPFAVAARLQAPQTGPHHSAVPVTTHQPEEADPVAGVGDRRHLHLRVLWCVVVDVEGRGRFSLVCLKW
jgi:hypothetical protein